jgi:hypothetical protein
MEIKVNKMVKGEREGKLKGWKRREIEEEEK